MVKNVLVAGTTQPISVSLLSIRIFAIAVSVH
jgi:hypothetical protein